MRKYEEGEKALKAAAAEANADDGWTVVTRKSVSLHCMLGDVGMVKSISFKNNHHG